MTEQTLLRLAMVLQDKAPTTLNKYICKLAEAILMEYPDGLNVFDIKKGINEQFNLSFTEKEIEEAIKKKGRQTITATETVYILSSASRAKLSQQDSIAERLQSIIREFLIEFEIESTEECVFSLLIRYLYFCFNSNVDNLLSLFEQEISPESTTFDASHSEIFIINKFITWDHAEKNKLVYHLTAMCYEYCMLTIKKDTILLILK